MNKDTSIAPKERINIQYKATTDDKMEDKELPLKLLIVGDFGSYGEGSILEERKVVGVNKHNLDDVMKALGVSIELPAVISGGATSEPVTQLSVESLKDFEPDNLVQKIPEISHLLELRKALMVLKGPMGNIPEFRRALEQIIKEKSSREHFKRELFAD